MSLTSTALWQAVAVGISATLLMDLWNNFLKRAFGIASLDYCLLGRWVLHMPGGTFAHEHIGRAPPRRLECPAGYATHYATGVAFALGFMLIAPAGWLDHPSAFPALCFGIGTVVFPYFVMQPALGLGLASSRAPRPWQARLKSLATHTVYGLGLYLAARALQSITAA